MDPGRFETVLPPAEFTALEELIERSRTALRGRVIWNVNSTARGGGVVEMLRPLLGHSRGAGVDARWVVLGGEPEFFALTKRLHNHLHGQDGDGGGLGAPEHAIYRQTLGANAAQLVPMLRPTDVVILHDPQTAGLVAPVHASGALVIWRSHIGIDDENVLSRGAWNFLAPYIAEADAYVFSRQSFVWRGLASHKIAVIQPSIDVFSPKNSEQSPDQSLAILARAGLTSFRSSAKPVFTRSDGTAGRVDRRAEVMEMEPLGPDARIVTQVSRWDRLKDPLGVLRGFVAHLAAIPDVHLVLAGPAAAAVADDPEATEVLESARAEWASLPEDTRARVHLISLPMDDLDENAAMVNALQSTSEVVVQKSLAEGFGLTVAEAMWKRRPVVASRIGGIQDQIVDGESGVLLRDPLDLAEFGRAVTELLREPDRGRRMGAAAHRRVRDHFLEPHHLARYFELIEELTGERESGAAQSAVVS